MTQEEISLAFENRWRIKGFDDEEVRQLSGNAVKKLCRDFFETGILLSAPTEPTSPTAPTEPTISTQDFEEWWKLYGKKIDRAKCEKKWRKLTPAERQACIAATPAYVASTPDLQYRRHPMTYLNNKSWENQIINRNGIDKQSQREQLYNDVAGRIAKYTKDA